MRQKWTPMGRLWAAAATIVAAVVVHTAVAGADSAAVTAKDFEFDGPGATTPAAVTLTAGGTVTFSYPSGASAHDVHFTGAGPSACTGSTGQVGTAPGVAGPGWSAACTFSTTGTYRFVCDAHSSMTGMVTVIADEGPTATFSSQPSTPAIGASVSFDGSGSHDPDGAIASYAWAFGDGSAATGPSVVHAYAAAGNYAVTLTVTDTSGATAVIGHLVGVDRRPTASFSFTPAAPLAGAAVAFDASASTDPDGTVASYAWGFGDGAIATGAAPSHAFATAGVYQVKLTVTDNAGSIDQVTHGVQVGAPTPAGGGGGGQAAAAPGGPAGGGQAAHAPVVSGLDLASVQSGFTLKASVSLGVSGSRFEADLDHGGVRLGRTIEHLVRAGQLQFAVTLASRGRRALARMRRLALTLRISVTPPGGATSRLARKLTLRLPRPAVPGSTPTSIRSADLGVP